MKVSSKYSKHSLLAVFMGVATLLLVQNSFAGSLDKLPSNLQSSVRSGAQVMVEAKRLDFPNAPWNQYTLYQKIAGVAPVEAAAVFADFDLHKAYFPETKESRVVRTFPQGILHVDYKVDLGFGLTDENHLEERLAEGAAGSYRVDWHLLQESNHVDMIQGNVTFEQFDGGTLMVYSVFIVPKSSMLYNPSWSWIVDLSKSKLKGTVTALTNRIVNVKSQNPGLLQQELNLLSSYLR